VLAVERLATLGTPGRLGFSVRVRRRLLELLDFSPELIKNTMAPSDEGPTKQKYSPDYRVLLGVAFRLQ
jgi:hypothetical protein